MHGNRSQAVGGYAILGGCRLSRRQDRAKSLKETSATLNNSERNAAPQSACRLDPHRTPRLELDLKSHSKAPNVSGSYCSASADVSFLATKCQQAQQATSYRLETCCWNDAQVCRPRSKPHRIVARRITGGWQTKRPADCGRHGFKACRQRGTKKDIACNASIGSERG